MFLDYDIRKCVVFLGHKDNMAGMGGIRCVGTGFLFHYNEVGYLVTVKHVAKQLGDEPFVVRVNRANGLAINLNQDNITWFYHSDNNIDVAVVECSFGAKSYEALYLAENIIAPIFLPDANKNNIGIGDMCYTIGLFRLLYGEKRNLPVVYSGNIALLPSDEKVPVEDWDDPTGKRRRYIEGYLINSQSLDGLSGSPVFARPTIDCSIGRDDDKGILGSMVAMKNVYLIGIWQGAWNAPPDQILSNEIEKGKTVRASIGMGVVVPVTKLIELLEIPELQKRRAAIKAEREASVHAAEPDSVRRPSNQENPQHKEDFNSLVSAAVQKKPQDD